MLDSTRNIVLACALSALAGYGDGIGFIHLGGLFVAGSVCGAWAYHWINLAAIWFAAGLALLLSAMLALTIHL